MTDNGIGGRFVPGMYLKQQRSKRSIAQLAEQRMHEWERNRLSSIKDQTEKARVNNCICISRKIGVGALEIADLVAERTGLHVIDREILEYIANDTNLKQTAIDSFDERHPGVMNNIGAMVFGGVAFTMDDYMKHLISTVYSMADDSPIIFVGRGTHLILPRERTLAVRIVCSSVHRVRRVAEILDIDETEAAKKLEVEDRQQYEFFRRNFNKKEATPYEFDVTFNADYLPKAAGIAELIEQAYKVKFGSW
jgi:cytidylate kinase